MRKLKLHAETVRVLTSVEVTPDPVQGAGFLSAVAQTCKPTR